MSLVNSNYFLPTDAIDAPELIAEAPESQVSNTALDILKILGVILLAASAVCFVAGLHISSAASLITGVACLIFGFMRGKKEEVNPVVEEEDFPADLPQEVDVARELTGQGLAHLQEVEDFLKQQLRVPQIAELVIDYTEHRESQRKTYLEKVRSNGMELEHLSPAMKDDFNLVHAAVGQTGEAIRFASLPLRDNDDIVLWALRHSLHFDRVLEFASDRLKKNPRMVRESVIRHSSSIRFAHEDVRKILAIGWRAVQQNGRMLQHLDPTLQANYDLVKTAVANCGAALFYAHPDLRANYEIVRIAVVITGMALKFAPAFQSNPDIVTLAILSSHGHALQFADDSLKDNDDIVWIALVNDTKGRRRNQRRWDWEAIARFASPRIQEAIANGTFSWAERERPDMFQLRLQLQAQAALFNPREDFI